MALKDELGQKRQRQKNWNKPMSEITLKADLYSALLILTITTSP